MIRNLVVRAGMAVLGLVVTLAWWSFTGSSGADVISVQGIPAKVWAGGAATLEVEVESTSAARFSVSFNESMDQGRSIETWTALSPGTQRWTIDVPSAVGGYIELGAENPRVGDTLTWKILVNGEVVDEQTEMLEEELKPGYAFFLQSYFEDYSKGEFGDD